MGFLRLKHWDGGGWGKLVRWEVNGGVHGVTRPTAQGLACGREVSAVEALGKLGCLDGNSVMRKPSAGPRLKVPAPQANGVAARLRPPWEVRGATTPARRWMSWPFIIPGGVWQESGKPGC